MDLKKIIVNSGFLIFSKFYTLFLNIVIASLIARSLTISNYGVYAIISSYTLVVGIFADFGLSNLLLRDSHKFDNKEEYLSNMIITRIILSVVVSFIGFSISFLIPQYSLVIRLGIAIFSIGTISNSVAALVRNYYQTINVSIIPMISEISGITAGLVLMFIYLIINNNIYIIFIILSLTFVIRMVISLVFLFRRHRLVYRFNRKVFAEYTFEGYLLALVAIISTVYFKADSIILSIMKPYSDVAIYSVAYKFVDVFIALPSVIMAPIFSLMSKSINEKNIKEAQIIFIKAFKLIASFGSLVLPAILIFSKYIIFIYAGIKYNSSVSVLNILSITIFLSFLGNVFIYGVMANKKQNMLSYYFVLLSVFNIVTNVIFIPHFSYIAAAWLTDITELFVLIGGMWISYKYCKLYVDIRTFLQFIVYVIVMSILSLALLGSLNILLLIILYIFISSVFIFLIYRKEILQIVNKR